jgi:hypothetical protein
MASADPASLSQFLNYGGLGLLAILCIVVLGYNAWSLNSLVAKAAPDRIQAARPLLLGQMGVSLVGLLAVGAGGIYLDRLKVEDNRVRTVEVVLDPWSTNLPGNPNIRVRGSRSTERPISVPCTPGPPAVVNIDLQPLIDHRISSSRDVQPILAPLAHASGGQ